MCFRNRRKLDTGDGGTVIERTERFIIPACDTRSYRGLVLANQFKVLLISDPTTTESFASLCLNVGSQADPVEHQGLAHLLEHLLLTVPTKKFPEENSFDAFLLDHSGSFYAKTSGHQTVYYFQVNSEAFEQCLDRFAQLFAEPLFKRERIEREIDIIQAEFELSLTEDDSRSFRVIQVTRNKPSHPFAKFAGGNKHTLKMDDDRLLKAVCKFCCKWFSANLMTLVVLDKEPLDKLESLVVGLFGQIVNHNRTPFRIKLSKYCRREIKIVPFKNDTVKLSVFFAIPDKLDLHYACYFIGFLLNNSTENGSLKPFYAYGSEWACFDFTIQFSTVNDEQARINAVKLIFQYFEMIKSTPPDQLERAYCEMLTMNQARFDYSNNKENIRSYVQYLSIQLHTDPFEEVISRKKHIISDNRFNYRKFMKVFKYLSVDCVNLQFTSASVKNEPIELQTEPHYGVEYSEMEIDSSVLEQWTNCGRNDKFTLPSPSSFVPSDFKLKPRLEKLQLDYPTELALDNPRLRVWHLQDSIFQMPKVFVAFRIKCPFIQANTQNKSLVEQFVADFRSDLNRKFRYQTKVANIAYSVQVDSSALEITFKGFNHKLDTFIYVFFERLIHNCTYMSSVHIKNTASAEVDQTNDPDIITLLSKCHIEIFKSEFRTELNQNSVEAISDFKLQPFANCQVRMFVHGNMTKVESIHLSKKVFGMLTKLITVIPESVSNKVNNLPQKMHNVQMKQGVTRFVCINPESNLNCLYMIFQIDKPIDNASMSTCRTSDYTKYVSCSKWFNNFLGPLYRAQLRNNEQLAYVIQVVNFEMLLMSSYSVLYLWSRTEAFIESIEKILIDLPEQAVTKLKNVIIDSIKSTSHNLYERSDQLWNEILLGKNNDDKVSSMASITKDDLINFYRDYIRMDGPKSRRLVIMIKGGKCEHKIGKESIANLNLQTGKTFTNIEQLRRERTDLVSTAID